MRYDLLREKIQSSGKTLTHIASVMGLSREGLYNKLDGTTEFKLSEINSISKELGMTKNERDRIFFDKNVD